MLSTGPTVAEQITTSTKNLENSRRKKTIGFAIISIANVPNQKWNLLTWSYNVYGIMTTMLIEFKVWNLWFFELIETKRLIQTVIDDTTNLRKTSKINRFSASGCTIHSPHGYRHTNRAYGVLQVDFVSIKGDAYVTQHSNALGSNWMFTHCAKLRLISKIFSVSSIRLSRHVYVDLFGLNCQFIIMFIRIYTHRTV